ncbi:MAG: hypothetical protein P8P36_09160 [Akkermansiaceae bacterium]|nr:hypothetical protein [Akkermansiaceae bacterium]
MTTQFIATPLAKSIVLLGKYIHDGFAMAVLGGKEGPFFIWMLALSERNKRPAARGGKRSALRFL